MWNYISYNRRNEFHGVAMSTLQVSKTYELVAAVISLSRGVSNGDSIHEAVHFRSYGRIHNHRFHALRAYRISVCLCPGPPHGLPDLQKSNARSRFPWQGQIRMPNLRLSHCQEHVAENLELCEGGGMEQPKLVSPFYYCREYTVACSLCGRHGHESDFIHYSGGMVRTPRGGVDPNNQAR